MTRGETKVDDQKGQAGTVVFELHGPHGGGGITKGRYAVFAGESYYPDAGWLGHYKSFDTIEAARSAAGDLLKMDWGFRWWQIVDLEKQRIVESEGSAYESMDSMQAFKLKEMGL